MYSKRTSHEWWIDDVARLEELETQSESLEVTDWHAVDGGS